MLAAGALAYDPVSLKWNALFLTACAIPLALRAIPHPLARLTAIWGAIVFVGSSLLGMLFPPDLITLPPNFNRFGVTTDSMGFRTLPQVAYSTKRGLRVFAIGGSTTEEIQRADDETWPRLLQEKLTRELKVPVEVVNTGVSGLRSPHHLATLKRVRNLEPDMIIVLLGINDWNAHVREHFSKWHRPERFSSSVRSGWRERLLARNTLIGRALLRLNHAAAFGVRPPKIIRVADRRKSLELPLKREFKPEAVSPEFDCYLRRIGELAQAEGLPCLFLTQPTAYRLDAPEELKRTFWMTPPGQDYTLGLDSMVHLANLYNAHLERVCRENGWLCQDLAAELPATAEVCRDDCHFTAEGSRLTAASIAPEVAKVLRTKEGGR